MTKLIDETGTLSSGVGMLTAPPGGDVCNVYLLDNSYLAFKSKKIFSFLPASSRTNFKSGIVGVHDNTLKDPMIGIANADFSYGIHVNIQVVAVVSRIDE